MVGSPSAQRDRVDGGQGISIALLIQSFDPTLQSLLQTVITGKESATIPNAKYSHWPQVTDLRLNLVFRSVML